MSDIDRRWRTGLFDGVRHTTTYGSLMDRDARHLWLRYAFGLASSNMLAAFDISVVIALLTRSEDGPDLVTRGNVVLLVVLVVISAAVGSIGGVLIVVPALKWFSRDVIPTPRQQYAAMQIAYRQTLLHLTIWWIAGAVFILINRSAGAQITALIALAVLFGGAATACMGYLVTERTLRPVIAAAMAAAPLRTSAPGVLARLIITWMLCSALPAAAIVLIVVADYAGWIIPTGTSIAAPVLILAALSLGIGFRGIRLVARSVSDPVREVSNAMGDVEQGRTDIEVGVYDSSEIGRLQTGFNRMVAGLAERERIRDLFGRHVGHDVAQRALEQETLLGGDVQRVAVLFIDLVGSTALAATKPPNEVAAVLNDFFRIVVTAVDDHQGLINKFEGDAALAIFGAPLVLDDPAGAALATARTLRTALRSLDPVDFGIGVSFGSVFAGNIGAEQRYEYTVIGDPVNEAARLTELAKSRETRILSAHRAVEAADASERALWNDCGSVTLRGRSEPTLLAEPAVAAL